MSTQAVVTVRPALELIRTWSGGRQPESIRAAGPLAPQWLLLSSILAVVAGDSEWEEPGFPQRATGEPKQVPEGHQAHLLLWVLSLGM